MWRADSTGCHESWLAGAATVRLALLALLRAPLRSRSSVLRETVCFPDFAATIWYQPGVAFPECDARSECVAWLTRLSPYTGRRRALYLARLDRHYCTLLHAFHPQRW